MPSRRIMILEDDPGILEVTIQILKMDNYEIKTLTSINYLNEIALFKPHVVLLDLHLRGSDVHENPCRQIKEQCACKVIIFSARHEIEKVAARCEADGYIRKPFELEAFEKQISSYFSE